MTQYTITSWFIIKSCWGHLAQTSWFLISNAEILCRWWWCLLFVLTNLYLPPFPARIFHTQMPLSPNMESTSSTPSFQTLFRFESLLHNQTPTSKFLVPSTRVKWVDMSRWDSIYSYSWVDGIPSTHTHPWVWVDGFHLLMSMSRWFSTYSSTYSWVDI